MKQIDTGLPAEALEFTDIPVTLVRGEYLALHAAGARAVEDLLTLAPGTLAQVLGESRAEQVAASLTGQRQAASSPDIAVFTCRRQTPFICVKGSNGRWSKPRDFEAEMMRDNKGPIPIASNPSSAEYPALLNLARMYRRAYGLMKPLGLTTRKLDDIAAAADRAAQA